MSFPELELALNEIKSNHPNMVIASSEDILDVYLCITNPWSNRDMYIHIKEVEDYGVKVVFYNGDNTTEMDLISIPSYDDYLKEVIKKIDWFKNRVIGEYISFRVKYSLANHTEETDYLRKLAYLN